MSESQHEHGHGVGDEIKSLEHEAEVGESARTPAIAIGGVGPSNACSNQSRVASEKTASGSIPPDYPGVTS